MEKINKQGSVEKPLFDVIVTELDSIRAALAQVDRYVMVLEMQKEQLKGALSRIINEAVFDESERSTASNEWLIAEAEALLERMK